MDRRTFLKVMAGSVLLPWGAMAEPNGKNGMRRTDGNKVVILSDPHVGVLSGQWQRDGLEGRVSSILAMDPLPKHVLILGDLSYMQGEVEDYEIFGRQMLRLEQAGVEWHGLMGNHDNRDAFWEVFPEQREKTIIKWRQVSVVRTPCSDFVLLDSLVEGKTYGSLNERQRTWLKGFLERQARPTFICAHHTLSDVKVREIVERHPHVAGYFHGHLHSWQSSVTQKGLTKVAFPTTGQWGDVGYAVLTQDAKSATLKLSLIDHYDPMPIEPPKVNWLEQVRRKNGSEVVFPFA